MVKTGQKNRQVVVDASEEAASTPTKVLRSGKRLAATPAPAAVKTGGKQLPTKSTTKLGRTAKDARSAQQELVSVGEARHRPVPNLSPKKGSAAELSADAAESLTEQFDSIDIATDMEARPFPSAENVTSDVVPRAVQADHPSVKPAALLDSAHGSPASVKTQLQAPDAVTQVSAEAIDPVSPAASKAASLKSAAPSSLIKMMQSGRAQRRDSSSSLLEELEAAELQLQGITRGLSPSPSRLTPLRKRPPAGPAHLTAALDSSASTVNTPTHLACMGRTPDNTPAQAQGLARPQLSELVMQEALLAYSEGREAGEANADEGPPGEEQLIQAVPRSPTPEDIPKYIPRGQPKTPYLAGKIKALQAREWSAVDEAKPHISRLQREKDAAAASRTDDLHSADKALTKRLVQRAFAKVVSSEGKGLGESLIKHKSKLEKAKEEAARQRREQEARAKAAVGQSPVPPKGDWSEGGIRAALGAGSKHRSRLQVEKEAAASGPSQRRYMKSTSASLHKQAAGGAGLEESLVKHVSQLEKAKLAAKQERSRLGTSSPAKPPARTAGTWEGPGLGSLPQHKSKLEREKEAWKRHDQGAAQNSHPARGRPALPKLAKDAKPQAARSTVPTVDSPRFMQPTRSFIKRTDRNTKTSPELGKDFTFVPN